MKIAQVPDEKLFVCTTYTKTWCLGQLTKFFLCIFAYFLKNKLDTAESEIINYPVRYILNPMQVHLYIKNLTACKQDLFTIY